MDESSSVGTIGPAVPPFRALVVARDDGGRQGPAMLRDVLLSLEGRPFAFKVCGVRFVDRWDSATSRHP